MEEYTPPTITVLGSVSDLTREQKKSHATTDLFQQTANQLNTGS